MSEQGDLACGEWPHLSDKEMDEEIARARANRAFVERVSRFMEEYRDVLEALRAGEGPLREREREREREMLEILRALRAKADEILARDGS